MSYKNRNNPFTNDMTTYVPWERGKQIRCAECGGLLTSELSHVNLSECTTDFFESNVTQTHQDDPTGWESDCEDVMAGDIPWGADY